VDFCEHSVAKLYRLFGGHFPNLPGLQRYVRPNIEMRPKIEALKYHPHVGSLRSKLCIAHAPTIFVFADQSAFKPDFPA
jgi:hypothetical protein